VHGFWTLLSVAAGCLTAADTVVLPPPSREVCSPSKAYCLTVRTADGWRSPQAIAEMRLEGRVLWSKNLPHELGPRAVLVRNTGEAVLFDEWIHVLSSRAITILDRSGQPVRTVGFREIQEAVGLPASQITSRARFGPWMVAPPSLDADAATVPVGQKQLIVHLPDGRLSSR
jgi:hypothetical protein